MSLLPNYTNANSREAYFLTANAQLINVSTLNAGNANINVLNASTISTASIEVDMLTAYEGTFSTFSTSQIVIDSQTLNATPTELLLNGVPVATQSSLSSIADWSLDPAISTVQMLGNDLNEAGLVSSLTVRAGNGLFNNLVAFNSLFVSSNTSTISSVINSADLGIFSTLQAGTISSGAISCQTISAPVGAISSLASDFLQASTISCMTLSSLMGSFSTLEITGLISTPDIEVSTINGAAFGASSITVPTGQFSSLVTTAISSLGAEIRQALISTIVFSPSLNPSLGGVNVNMGLGGILGNVIGWGAGVFGAAAGVVGLVTGITALATGRQTQNIDNSRYETVNGTTQLQFSTLGVPFSTIYRFNNSADPERVPGEEIFISTVSPAGLAVRSVSDPLYTLSTPSSTIQAFGQWVPAPAELVNVSTFSTIDVVNLNANRINTSSIVGGEASLLTIGAPLIYLSSSPGLGGFVYTDGDMNALRFKSQEVLTSTLQTSSITASTLAALTVSSDVVNTQYVTNSTISTATILGANPNLLGVGVQGLEIRTEPTGQIWISSPQTNIAGLTNTSTVGSLQFQGRAAFISTANISSLFASTVTIAGLSSIILSTSGTAGLAAQPAGRLMLGGNDLDLGQQDLWAQQVRVGAGNPGGSAQTEVIWYSPDNLTIRGLGLGGSDLTLRVQSTINSGTNNGYLLDTTINRPFFSTINNSTCMMASYPSTSLGNFGVSTLAVIPPIQVYGGFYSSTSQTVAGANTITPLTYNSQSLNVGGLTFAGSTITVPIAGTYEITHSIQFDTTSGGTNEAYFWLKKNGTDIPQSASIVSIVNNGETLGTISLLDTAAAGDQYAVCIASADTNMTAVAFPVSSFCPAIPAIITNIKRL